MAEEVEMIPVAGAEPPKANPLASPTATKVGTLKLNPVARKPLGGAPTVGLKPGLKLPPKPGLAAGLKLPPKPGAVAGLKLPPKPGAVVAAPKPGAAVAAPKPGATVSALRPGLKLPPKPVIRKPGATVVGKPLPKPVTPLAKPVAAPAVAEVAAPAAAPAAADKPAVPVEKPSAAPLAVDALGVGKLPTVEAKAIARDDTAPVVSENPKPLEALKTVTQKLKGVTQEIPQQAILRKTGIIAEGAMSDAQKEAAKHKTARISLSDAMGVAPVKNDAAPMKTIRIKRPVNIQNPTGSLKPPVSAEAETKVSAPTTAETKVATEASTVTQRKTLKIARPSGSAVRPGGKFGLKRPATSAAGKPPADDAKPSEPAADENAIADIPDIPNLPMTPQPVAAPASAGPAWLCTLSVLVQAAACVAIGALAWFLYQNTQTAYF